MRGRQKRKGREKKTEEGELNGRKKGRGEWEGRKGIKEKVQRRKMGRRVREKTKEIKEGKRDK